MGAGRYRLAGMSAELRIIDAAGNRAREGLRVLEDVARFGLDDAELSAELKDLRHGLRDGLGGLAALGAGALALVEGRDTAGDVGTGIEGSGEGARADLADVAGAAAGRVSEALRTLEEVSKVLGAGVEAGGAAPWMAFEALRYRVYEVHRRVAVGIRPAARQWRLCVLITERLCVHHPWEVVAERAMVGGADCLQLREKELESGELLVRARRLVGMARGRGVSVIVNDRADVALLAGADGVHVGQTDLGVAEVRRLGARPARRLLVGVSCSTVEQARAAVRDGADYLGLGPMFVSGTKARAVLAGVGLVREVVADPVASRAPHLAISGITAQNLGGLMAEGCRGVAVSGAVCGAEDVEGAARGLCGG